MGSVDPRGWSLARQVFALVAMAAALVVVAGVGAAWVQVRQAADRAAREEVLDLSRLLAQDPAVVRDLATTDPAATLQPLAEGVRHATGTDFVVVMSPEGIRYSHTDPALIGGRFTGTISPARDGRTVVETYTGSLGPSVRAVVPVRDGTGDIVGLVSVGITRTAIGRELSRQVPVLLVAGGIALAVSAAVAGLLGRRLARQTRGLGPAELSRLYEFYEAVLHAVAEGVLLLGADGRVSLVNDEAVRLLGLRLDAAGRDVGDVGLPAGLARALAAGGRRVDEIHLTGERVLVVNQAPARWAGRDLGTVVTVRDRTDLMSLAGELDAVRGLTEALRSQAHESSNRLHAVVSLIELGHTDRALTFATAELGGAQELTDRVVGAGTEPVIAAVVLGKAAAAAERGVDLVVPAALEVPEGAFGAPDLVTVVGNLLDNAVDAALAAPAPRRVALTAAVRGAELVVTVADTGHGVPEHDRDRVFERDWSTKPVTTQSGGRGLGLALVGAVVGRLGGTVEITGCAGPLAAVLGRPDGAVFTVTLPLTGAVVTPEFSP